MNIICVLSSDVFYGELPSKYDVNMSRSCVDFVLPKLFPRFNTVIELLQNKKWNVTQYGCLLKELSGVVFLGMSFL